MTESNPYPCQHSMVTDLCGLCIRDQQIAKLTSQNAELVAAANQYRELSQPENSAAGHAAEDALMIAIAKAGDV